jgi:hypothetical protein
LLDFEIEDKNMKIATLQELVDVVKSRDLELAKRDMEIDNCNLEIKEKNLSIQKLKERLQMACDTSIAALRENKRMTDVKTHQIHQLSLLAASFRADNETQDEDNDKAPARPLIDTCGWDPGRQNGLHLLLLRPTLLHRDATTTVLNISLPPLNPSASMRARQDEDNDEATARPSIDTCSLDPGKDEAEDGLSHCKTVFACPDYDDDGSTFDDDIDVAGESSG